MIPDQKRVLPARTPGRAFVILGMLTWLLPPIGASTGPAQDAATKVRVKASRPLRREVRDDVDLPGRIEPVLSVRIVALVGGRIEKVRIAPGQKVRRGEILMTIESRPYEEKLKKAEAEVQATQSRLEAKRSEAGKGARDAGDRGKNTRLQAECEAAEAAVAAAAKARDIARLELRFTELRSPFDGKVLGAVPRAGVVAEAERTELARIVSIDPVLVFFDIPRDLMLTIGRLRDEHKLDLAPGTKLSVNVHLEGGDGFACRGTFDLFGNAVDPVTDTFLGRATIPNPDERLRPDMSAHVGLPVGTPHKALLVPAEAVRSDAGVNYLFVVSPVGVLERRVVTVGLDRDGKHEVKKGLHADEWVVIQPPEQLPQALRAGSRVEVEKVPMPEGPSSAQRGPQRDGARR
jgi:multidrug efflux system membrane fusion protein